MPQAGSGARHLLGLRLADARDHPHADVGDVGSRHPAQLPDDAGVRRAHLPPGQRRRASRASSSSTGRRPPARTRSSGTRRSRSPAPTPTSIGAICGKRSRRARIRSTSSACRSSPRSRPKAFTFDVLDATKLVPEELVPDRAGRQAGAEPQPRQLLRRDRAGRLLHRARRSRASTSRTIRCSPGRIHSYVDTQISRLGGPNFHEIPINAPIAQVHNNQRDGMHRQAINRGRVVVRAELARRRLSVPGRRERVRVVPGADGRRTPTRSAARPSASPITTRRRRSSGTARRRSSRRTSSTPSASSCRRCRRRRSASGWCRA